jgi:hypothetical protein
MCSLNRDLRGREVAPDEDVQVRNLGERRVHEWTPSRIKSVAAYYARGVLGFKRIAAEIERIAIERL